MARQADSDIEDIRIVDHFNKITTEAALTVAAGTNDISSTYELLGADLITIYADITNAGSVIVQKKMSNSDSGSWVSVWTNETDGLGSLVYDAQTTGIIPRLRVIGSSVGSAIYVDIHYKTKL